MIIAKTEDAYRYYTLHPLLKTLFHFVARHPLCEAKEGRIEIEGNNLYINNGPATLRSPEERPLEVHRLYMDVHFPLNGVERIGWTSIDDLTDEPFLQPYQSGSDFATYRSGLARTFFDLHPGEFCIMFPEDAHAPLIGEGTLLKAVSKIRM